MTKPYIKQALSYSMVGSLGFTIVAGLQGCGDTGLPPVEQQAKTRAALLMPLRRVCLWSFNRPALTQIPMS